MGLAVRALAAHDLPAALALLGLEWLACAAFALVVLALLAHLLRFGLLAAGARESSRHERVSVAAKPPRRLVTALQARELKLLSRDRASLVQTMVLPVVILGAQFVFNGGCTPTSSPTAQAEAWPSRSPTRSCSPLSRRWQPGATRWLLLPSRSRWTSCCAERGCGRW
jgi:hypothetical protein